MKTLLVLLDDWFPANKKEAFLEGEVPFYSFDKAVFFPFAATENDPIRPLPPNSQIFYINKRKLPSLLEKLGRYWRSFFSRTFWWEFFLLCKKRQLTLPKLLSITVFEGKAKTFTKTIKRELKNIDVQGYDRIIFYSYWLHYHALSTIKLKKTFGEKAVAISRAHGFDLYEERSDIGYLPYREILLAKLDKVVCISEHGKNHLVSRYPDYQNKIALYRLGVDGIGARQTDSPRDKELIVVSCSRLVPVKRIHLLIESLSLVKIKVRWIHFGDGELYDPLFKLATEKLPENVTATFKGEVFNTEVLNFYNNNDIHVFVNTSESEGIPVSIMEALSFGIPVIAPAVGGVPECIDDGKNGYLLPKYFSPASLAAMLEKLQSMDDASYQSLRTQAYNTWAGKFNSEKNYREFDAFLHTLAGGTENA